MKDKKKVRASCLLSKERYRQTPTTRIMKQQPALYAVGYTYSFQISVQHECKHLCLLFPCSKNFADFSFWNNIVNAKTQYVLPQDYP